MKITYSEEAIAVDESKDDPRMIGMPVDLPGTKMIAESTCLGCHISNKSSIGPSYMDIAKKYSKKKDAVKYLSNKILKGGQGVWGEQPMPPNPQLDIEEALQMAEAILKTKDVSHDE